jgi:hypothetical protein
METIMDGKRQKAVKQSSGAAKKETAPKRRKPGELTDEQLKAVSGGARISKQDLLKLQ